jgi:CheY-like chemotaxis protein
VRLPLLPDARAAARPDDSENYHRPNLGGLRILIVEDMDDLRDSLALMLQSLGAEVAVARDGLEALDTVASHRPQVIQCDLQMPRMGGIEFIGRLRADPDAVQPPVIALTGTAGDPKRTETAGFAARIDKPVDANDLVRAIIRAVPRRVDGE